MKQKRLPDVLGLRLSRQELRVLKERGIFAHSPVSLEHQHLAKRYVVRGLESGGAPAQGVVSPMFSSDVMATEHELPTNFFSGVRPERSTRSPEFWLLGTTYCCPA